MITPDFRAFQRLARKGNLIALCQSIPADLETPVSCFLKLADGLSNSFLLESAEQAEQIGRYSIIGLEPSQVISSRGAHILVKERRRTRNEPGPMLAVLERAMAGRKLANSAGIPGFSGGLVGYFSYENVQDFESVRLRKKRGPDFPGAVFFLVNEYVVFDHFRKTMTVVVIAETCPGTSLKKTYEAAKKRVQSAVRKLEKPLARQKKRQVKAVPGEPRSNMNPAAFKRKVERIKKYIRAGDCIQVVLSQRFRVKAPRNDFLIYRALRSLNPSPYMFYFKSGKTRLIGSSPELLVKKEGNRCDVRPIAGTRPRGTDAADDLRLEENLKRSRKETAEHLMLVDLGRNDLGRVCRFDSIRVQNYAHVERFSHVMHLVSDVTGIMKSGKTAFDLLKAAFPAGTVSGAPKIRAMQIIDELEEETRGPYAGCLGFFGFNQDMEMCITIRTLMSDGKHLYIQAGAGIVKDSNPGREYQETVNKAKAMVQALSARENF